MDVTGRGSPSQDLHPVFVQYRTVLEPRLVHEILAGGNHYLLKVAGRDDRES